jgi:hypothetical protein
MTARKSLVEDDTPEPVEHVTTLRDVLVILANGVALQPGKESCAGLCGGA